MSPDPRAARSRAARRRFILDNHPDRGGDPEAFAAGLRAFGSSTAGPGARPPSPVTFYRRRGPLGRARERLARGEVANWKVWAARPRLGTRVARCVESITRRSGSGGTSGHWRWR